MPSTVHIQPAILIALCCSTLFVIVYPLVLAFIAHRQLKVSWRYVGYGALIFFLFQVITRVPLVQILGNVLAPQLKASHVFLYSWLAILAITAGLAEEIGRYVGYRWLMRREEKTWRKAVMYGIGHGGLESMLLVGGLFILTIVNLVVLSATNLNTLSPAQHAQVITQFASLNAQPIWTIFLGAWERLWTLPFHVAMSVVVLQVFRRNNIGWLWLAVLLHALFDGITVFIAQLLGSSLTTSLIVEGFVALVGIVSIWFIWRLRDGSEGTSLANGTKPMVSEATIPQS